MFVILHKMDPVLPILQSAKFAKFCPNKTLYRNKTFLLQGLTSSTRSYFFTRSYLRIEIRASVRDFAQNGSSFCQNLVAILSRTLEPIDHEAIEEGNHAHGPLPTYPRGLGYRRNSPNSRLKEIDATLCNLMHNYDICQSPWF